MGRGVGWGETHDISCEGCVTVSLKSSHPPLPSFAGLYVQAMADLNTSKLYSGLLGVGDEILEVNGAKVAGLGLAHIKELLAHAESLSIRVLRQRPVPQ